MLNDSEIKRNARELTTPHFDAWGGLRAVGLPKGSTLLQTLGEASLEEPGRVLTRALPPGSKKTPPGDCSCQMGRVRYRLIKGLARGQP